MRTRELALEGFNSKHDRSVNLQLDSLSLRIAESAPLKTHKYFRVAVPQALTGQTLVAFLQVFLFLLTFLFLEFESSFHSI